MKFRRRRHEMPGLNTASLPDLIFTVLFFFMLVTHMKSADVHVRYRVPEGQELARLQKKSSVVYIYIGTPVLADGIHTGKGWRIQVNNRVVQTADIEASVRQLRDQMNPEDAEQLTVSLRADRQVPVQTIHDVKQQLRAAGVTRINYAAADVKPQYSEKVTEKFGGSRK